jgi:hypothetical protein
VLGLKNGQKTFFDVRRFNRETPLTEPLIRATPRAGIATKIKPFHFMCENASLDED